MHKTALGALGIALLTSACAPNSPSTEAQRARVADGARVEMRNAKGDTVGTLTVAMDSGGGVRFTGRVRDLPPGEHGIHIHENGKCDPPDFQSAGAHFNPSGKQHGSENPQGPHEGDLRNLQIAQDGTAELSFVAQSVTLAEGGTSLLKPGGTSLVIHAKPDDLKTNPSGGSGERIACGIVTR